MNPNPEALSGEQQQFCLVCSLQTKRWGEPAYFKGDSAIGPMYTRNPDEAVLFDTEDEARRHPATYFSMTFFEPSPFPATTQSKGEGA